MMRSTVINRQVSRWKAGQGIGVVALLVASASMSCQRKLDDSDAGPASENLNLVDQNSTSMSATFHFPSDHRQVLAAPKGHNLEGAVFTTEPNSFDHDVTIAMKEAVPMATNRTAKNLSLQGALTGAGPAVLIASQDYLADANQAPVDIYLPVKIAQTDPGQNLTILYRVIQQSRGGREVTGLFRFDQFERADKALHFKSNFLGVFQAVYYNGDPAAIKEIRSADGFYAVGDDAAKTPGTFTLRTPSGQVTGTYPQASWSAATGAVSYEVTVAKNKDCNDVVRQYDGVSSAVKTLDGLTDGNYALCVTAISQGGTRTPATNNGLEFQLFSSQLGLFRYDAARVFATGTPQIRWTQSQNATGYNIAIASSSGCATPAVKGTTTQLTWTPAADSRLSDGNYYVCVSAVDGAGHKQMIDVDSGRPSGEGLAITIDTTKPGTFDIIGLGGPRGSVTWGASSEAVTYNLTIGMDTSCGQPVRTYNGIVGNLTSIVIPGLQENASYNVCLTSTDIAGNTRTANNNGSRFTFDTVAPRIASIEAVTRSGSYGINSLISIAVNFSEATILTGNSSDVRLQLNSGGVATYYSGSGSAKWIFNYKVISGANAAVLDYSSTNALTFGSAGARDGAGNAAIVYLPAPGSSGSLSQSRISIDTTAPTLVSSLPANNAKDVTVRPDITLTFSEPLSANTLANGFTITKANDSVNLASSFDSSFDDSTSTLKLTMKPNAPALQSATAYKIQLRGFMDNASNEITATTIQFTTK